VRVPSINVSLVDFKFDAKTSTDAGSVKQALIDASQSNRLKGILGISEEPLVSTDFNHDSHSSVVDIAETHVIDGSFVRVMSWYDNEWGFSNRMVDAAAKIGEMAQKA
jgi:glyceraldehyde 3-phosphate dehydrogenase